MDEDALAAMVFTLLLTIIIGGLILLFPLSRRLGALLEAKIREKTGAAAGDEVELARLRASVEAIETQLRAVSDRQEFMEKVLDARRSDLLPRR